MDQIKTGALIRTLRLNRHMTQLELANCMGISDKAISKWERGCGAPDIALLPALAQALNVENTGAAGWLPAPKRSKQWQHAKD